jgi:hypothetical protein
MLLNPLRHSVIGGCNFPHILSGYRIVDAVSPGARLLCAVTPMRRVVHKVRHGLGPFVGALE